MVGFNLGIWFNELKCVLNGSVLLAVGDNWVVGGIWHYTLLPKAAQSSVRERKPKTGYFNASQTC